MPRLLIIAVAMLTSVPVAAQESSSLSSGQSRSPVEVSKAPGERSVDQLERLFGDEPAPVDDDADGLLGSTFAAVERVLEKLGVSEEDLANALSGVHIEDAGDNWREESSGEVSLSFDVNERLSVGPSFGLRHEEENLGGVEEPWSQEVRFGARLNF